jgi:hypothetical protein
VTVETGARDDLDRGARRQAEQVDRLQTGGFFIPAFAKSKSRKPAKAGLYGRKSDLET